MGLRFRKSVKIAPGIRLNFNKKSTSVSFGGKGATYTVNSTGKKTTSVGIPGTGLYYTESVGGKKKGKGNMLKKAEKAQKVKKPFFKKWWFWTILVLILVGGAGGSGNNETADDTTKQVQSITVSGQRDDAAKDQTKSTVTTEPEEVKPVELVTEEPKEETQVVVAENETTTQESKETTEETKQEIEEVVAPPVEEPVIEEPVVEPEPVAPPVEVDPEVAFREKLNQYNYVGSAESDKYHKPKCRWTKEINDQNLVHFDTEEETNAAGYKPCGTCKP